MSRRVTAGKCVTHGVWDSTNARSVLGGVACVGIFGYTH